MTIEQIMLAAFGFPTLGLLTGIFFRLGSLTSSLNAVQRRLDRHEGWITKLQELMP